MKQVDFPGRSSVSKSKASRFHEVMAILATVDLVRETGEKQKLLMVSSFHGDITVEVKPHKS